jgi:hypothetical protein
LWRYLPVKLIASKRQTLFLFQRQLRHRLRRLLLLPLHRRPHRAGRPTNHHKHLLPHCTTDPPVCVFASLPFLNEANWRMKLRARDQPVSATGAGSRRALRAICDSSANLQHDRSLPPVFHNFCYLDEHLTQNIQRYTQALYPFAHPHLQILFTEHLLTRRPSPRAFIKMERNR